MIWARMISALKRSRTKRYVAIRAAWSKHWRKAIPHLLIGCGRWQWAILRRAYQQMTLLGRRTATERIAYFLLDMHRRSTSIDSRIVGVPMSRLDIANYLV